MERARGPGHAAWRKWSLEHLAEGAALDEALAGDGGDGVLEEALEGFDGEVLVGEVTDFGEELVGEEGDVGTFETGGGEDVER